MPVTFCGVDDCQKGVAKVNWVDERVALSSLSHPEKNVRQHSDKQVNELMRALAQFGQLRPIIIDENGVVLAGNGLMDAMIAAGYTNADAKRVTGATENQKKKIMISDNRIFELGTNNHVVLDEFLSSLSDDLDIPGYDENLLRALNASEDEVDRAISDFGLVTAPEKERIEGVAADRASVTISTGAEPKEDTLPSASAQMGEQDRHQSEHDFVICPKCGEKIWLG